MPASELQDAALVATGPGPSGGDIFPHSSRENLSSIGQFLWTTPVLRLAVASGQQPWRADLGPKLRRERESWTRPDRGWRQAGDRRVATN